MRRSIRLVWRAIPADAQANQQRDQHDGHHQHRKADTEYIPQTLDEFDHAAPGPE